MTKKISVLEVVLVLIFFISLTLALTIFFPQPYNFFGIIDSASSNDGEADYFANVVATYMNGYPLNFHHPGIPVTYFSALLISIFKNINSVEGILLLCRGGLLFLNLLLIYLGSRILLKQNISSFFILLIILFCFPASFILLDQLGPDSILFGLGILIISLGYRLNEKFSYTQLSLFSITIGLAISIKFSSLIFFLPYIFSLLFVKNNIFFLKALTVLATCSIITICVICWSILPFFPFVLTQFEIFEILINFKASEYFFLLPLASLIIILMSIFIINKLLKMALSPIIAYTYMSGFILSLGLIYSIFLFFITSSFHELGIVGKNMIPIMALSVVFLNKVQTTKFYYFNNLYILFSIFILCLFVKIISNNSISTIASKEDQDFSRFVDQVAMANDYVVFYPASISPSEEYFLAWSDYRYGDISKSFFEERAQIPFVINDSLNKIRFLNSRFFDLSNFKDKNAYLYFNFIKNSKFFSKSHKNIASKQISLLSPKDLCSNLFQDYNQKQSFTIIFPASLNTYSSENDSKESDFAINYITKLRNKMSEQCNLKTQISKTLYKDQKLYLLTKK